MSLRETILAAADRQRRAVEVPEWGCTVYLAAMSGKQKNAWEAEVVALGERRLDNYQARLLARVLEDESGAPIFSGEQLDELGGKSAAVLARLFKIANELNGFAEEQIEDAEKN